MTTTKAEISEWFDAKKAEGCAYMVVVCDTFEWADYPVGVKPGANLKLEVQLRDNRNMQRVMEVYDLNADKDGQLKMTRVRADLKPPVLSPTPQGRE